MKNIIILVGVIFIWLFVGCDKCDSLINQNGVTFTRIVSETDRNYELDGNIVNYDEILGYDSSKCIFLLSEKAGERIRNINYPVIPTRFAIAVDGEFIYIANFIPGYSSASCLDCIIIEPYTYNNKYRVRLSYPASYNFSGIDPRNDRRILQRLQKDKKLITIEE